MLALERRASSLLRSPPLAALLLPLALAGGVGCDDGVACFEDAKCGAGQRCEGAGIEGPGLCVPCDAVEIPYDGVDNDCSLRTPDFDLDGDGQNAASAQVQAGRDCDDTNPDVFAGAPELCGDDVDSDCDGEGGPGQVDDPDCGDTSAPAVTVLSPTSGARVSGTLTLTLGVQDDTGVVGVALFVDGLQIDSRPIAAVARGEVQLDLDTRRFPDGPLGLRVEVRDRADRTGASSVRLVVDNLTPPSVQIQQPTQRARYAGRMPIRALFSDPDGIDREAVRLSVDGGLVTVTASSAGLALELDTADLSEGEHMLELRVADLPGNVATATRGFTVDRTGPQISFDAPAPMARLTGVVRVSVTATDAAGVSRLASRGQTSAGAALPFDLDTTQLPNGPFVITATAADGAIVDGIGVGNVATAGLPVVIQNVDTSPRVSFVRPRPNQTVLGPTEIELAVQGGDAMNQVELRVDGVLAATLERSPFVAEVDLRGDAGPRRLDAVVTDGQGRTDTASVSVTQAASPRLRLARSTRPAAGSVADFEVADFDADGTLDVITAGSRVELHAGTRGPGGAYTQAAPVTLANERFSRVALVDLDQDQDLDLVGLDGRNLSFALNTNGQLTLAPNPLPLPENGIDVLAAEDLDGDGDPDLVLAGGSAAAGYVYTWTGATFQRSQTLGGDGGVAAVALAVADGDTFVDIVVTRERTQTISVFRNDGMGRFGAGIDSAPRGNGFRVAVGDVTGDGFPDVLLGTAGGPELLAGQASAPGSFTSRGAGTGDARGGIALGDVDADPELEVVAIDVDARAAAVWSLDAMGALREDGSYLVGGRPEGIELADLDADGRLDVLTAVDDVVVRLDNGGGGRLRAPVVIRTGFRVDAFALGQVSGSTQTDVVVVDGDADVIRVLEGDGRFGFTERATIELPMGATSFEAVAIGQIDGLRGADIAAVMGGSGTAPRRLVALAEPGGGFVASAYPGDADEDLAVGELDGQPGGEVAMLLSNRTAGQNGVEIIDAMGMSRATLFAGQEARRVVVGRFDGSAPHAQLAVANVLSENITVHTFRANAFASTTYNAPTGLTAITAGGVANHTQDDLVGVAGDRVFVMESNPVLGFRPPVQTVAGRGLVDAAVLDVTRDGLRDVVAAGSGELFLLVAQASGSLFPALEARYAPGATRMRQADVDGDGRADLVSAHPSTQILVVVPNDDERF